MKTINIIPSILLLLFSNASWSLSETAIELDEPQIICFDKNSSSNKISSFTYNHKFTPQKNDIYKEGLVFVFFKLKSDPEKIFIMNGDKYNREWIEISDENSLNEMTGILLKPLLDLDIIITPMDLSSFQGDGEILVGYGIKHYDGQTSKEIFDDMIINERYSTTRVLEDNFIPTRKICITYTHIEEIDQVNSTP